MKLDAEQPLRFRFIIDTGDKALSEDQSLRESEKLTRYFLVCLTVPEKDLWVNLSPVEKDRITSSALMNSDLGQDLLQQDFLLKKLMSSLLDPDGKTGRDFWDRVYQRVYQKHGSTNVPVESFHKVWIMPESAELYVNNGVVLIMNSRLKVLLEEDYLARDALQSFAADQSESGSVKQMIREMIIPEVVRQVNEAEQFAPLRQIYHALILAKWYKENLKSAIVNDVYSDRSKVEGINGADPGRIGSIYQDYLDVFRGSTRLHEEYDSQQGEIIAKEYVSGGFLVDEALEFSGSDLNPPAAMELFEQSFHGDGAMLQFDAQALSQRPALTAIRLALLTVMLVVALPFFMQAAPHADLPVKPKLNHEIFDVSDRVLAFDGPNPDSIPTIDTLIDIFSRYYRVLDARVQLEGSQEPTDLVHFQEQEMLVQIRRILSLPEAGVLNQDNILGSMQAIQDSLKQKGYYFSLRWHPGFEYEGKFFQSPVLEALLCPIISRETRNVRVGDIFVTYTEVVLGKNLIERSEYIPTTIELTSPDNEIFLMPEQYRTYVEFYYEQYVELEAHKNPPYTNEGELWLRQWQWDEDAKRMSKDQFIAYAMQRMTDYYRAHAQQHIADFEALRNGKLKFPEPLPGVSEELNAAAHMEMRALLRQMIDGILPYQALMDFGNFYILRTQFGDDSEYAMAAEIAYKTFNDNLMVLYGDKFLSKDDSLGPAAVKIRREVFEEKGFIGLEGELMFYSGGLPFLSPKEISRIALETYNTIYPKEGKKRKGKKSDKDDAQLAPGGVDLATSAMEYVVKEGSHFPGFDVSVQTPVSRGISGFSPVNIRLIPLTDLRNIFSN